MGRKLKLSLDIDYIINEYNKNRTLTSIAKELEVGVRAIKLRLIDNNIEIRKSNDNSYVSKRNIKNNYPQCFAESCSEKSIHKTNGNFYCGKHYRQMNKHGKILSRTKNDPNEFIELDSCYKVITYDIHNFENGYGYFDKEYFDLIKKYKWQTDRQGYIVTFTYENKTKSRVAMHRLIMNISNPKIIVDHKDLKKNNNRKYNLRISDDSKNEMNKGLLSNNKSGVKGVYFVKRQERWNASLECKDIPQKNHRLVKRYKVFDDAVKQRIIWEAEYFKEYSNNYCPDSNTINLNYISKDDNLQTQIEVDLQSNIIKFTKIQ